METKKKKRKESYITGLLYEPLRSELIDLQILLILVEIDQDHTV